MRNDFDFLTGVAQEFFAKKSIKDTLAIISEFDISGWEKWIQIEFAKFCKSHGNITHWGRELRYELDKRMSKHRSSCAIDFLIQQKYKQSPLAIEIKQKNSARGCINSMLMDVAKIRNIKYSHDDLRGVWCMGIHHLEELEEIKNLVSYCSRKVGLNINPNFIFSKRIGRTDFSVTVFPNC